MLSLELSNVHYTCMYSILIHNVFQGYYHTHPPLPSWNRKWKGHFLRAKLKCRINSKRRGRAAHVWLFRQ